MATRAGTDLEFRDSLAERFSALCEISHFVAGREPSDVFAFLASYPEATTRERLAVVLVDQQARWRTNRGRPVEDYLGRVTDVADDPQMVDELIQGELHARLALGERLTLSDFADRFPWLNPRTSSTDDTVHLTPRPDDRRGLLNTLTDGGPLADAWPITIETPGPTRRVSSMPTFDSSDYDPLAFHLAKSPDEPSEPSAGVMVGKRFSIQHRIGRGGMGIVYKAFDHARGEYVALKTMRKADPSALWRFKQEFRILADLSHPNLVNLHEMIAVGQAWFFTMELIAGVDFVTSVRFDGVSIEPAEGDDPEFPPPSARLPSTDPLSAAQLSRLRHSLKQLAEGVQALHEAGKLHRDVKPTNVLVSPEGRVVLLDFGLSADLEPSGLHSSDGGRVVGTVGYMSPEQAAGQALGIASDWYSVGVILYEALTGLLPINGRSDEVLAEKQVVDPPPPTEVAEGVPPDLNALCVELLRREPGSRPKGPAILARLLAERPAGSGRGAALPLIGRARHRESLAAAYAEMKAGRTVVLFVSGRPGSGKSTLLQAFLSELAEGDGAVILSGRCYERESVPYKALDSVVDALCSYLMPLPAAEVDMLLPRDIALLARMFPVLQRVEAVAEAKRDVGDTTDQQEIRRRAVAALRSLLTTIGETKPLVVAIDDLQWGDPENAALIEGLVKPPDPPLMLLIGSFRTEDAENSPLVRTLLRSEALAGGPERRELAVGALSNAESRELALALLGRNDAAAKAEAHLVARESQGNPFFIDELVKSIQSDEGLTGRGSLVGQITLDEVLWNRVARLPDASRRLLEVVAVSGRPVRLLDACQAAGLGAEGRVAAASLRAGRLVRGAVRPHRDEVEAYHDWVRETVVSHLPPEVVAGHHLRLARVLEAAGSADAETLAAHYQAAGFPDRAADFYATAAAKSAGTLAFAHAARLYRLALGLRPEGGDDAEAVRLRTRLGDALADAGRGNEAAVEYVAASEHVAAAADALELKRKAATQWLISGHVDEGLFLLRTVLKVRGMSLPASPTGALLALIRRRAWLRVRG